jgi:purine-binding chemotaxis protein CheW
MMSSPRASQHQLLLFEIDDQRFALRAEAVVEVVRAVEITPLAGAPGVVLGIIDLRGQIVPVFDLRKRFGRAQREVDPADHFIIARAARRTVALHVDHARDLIDVDASAIAPLANTVHAAPHVAGVATLADGLAVIQDLDAFLSAVEADSLDAALSATP